MDLVFDNAVLYCTDLILFENDALDGWSKVTSLRTRSAH